MMLHSGKNRAGLSVMELLVVVGMVATLAAVVFPVLAQVDSRQEKCLNNLKQIAVAVKMYMSDWGDAYPRTEIREHQAVHPETGETFAVKEIQWFWTVYYDGQQWQYEKTTLGGVMTPYIPDADMIICPDWQRDFAGVFPFQSYGHNVALGFHMGDTLCPADWRLAHRVVTRALIRDPAATIMLADSNCSNRLSAFISPPCWQEAHQRQRPSYRHGPRYDEEGNVTGGIFNAAFCDGHVQACDSDVYYVPGDGTYWDYK